MTLRQVGGITQQKRFVDTQKSDVYGLGMKKSGATLLRDWIAKTGRKATWVASEIPVNRSHLHQWLNGKYTPRDVYRIRIFEVTGGAVPVDSWGDALPNKAESSNDPA